MTQHTMNNTHDQSEIFFDIMQDLQDCSTGFETGVDIPVDLKSEANNILMESKYGNLEIFHMKRCFNWEGMRVCH